MLAETQEFTLRIIFYGLIAFVPHEEGDGMMALVVEDGSHDATVVALEGCCESGEEKCLREGDGLLAGLDLRKKWEWPFIKKCTPLSWGLSAEHLEIDATPVVDRWKVAGGRPQIEGEPAPYPEDATEAKDFTWVPEMEKIIQLAAEAKGSCLRSSCPEISSRFRLTFGDLEACHFLHGPENGLGDYLGVVEFAGGYEQAVADAVVVEAKIKGTELSLVSKDYGGAEQLRVELRPQKGVVTLLVSNLAWESAAPRSGRAGRIRSHFDRFFGLAANGTAPRLLPREQRIVALGFETGCERELARFEKRLKKRSLEAYSMLIAPHNNRECDSVQFKQSDF